jgi:hypothetical protein
VAVRLWQGGAGPVVGAAMGQLKAEDVLMPAGGAMKVSKGDRIHART